MSSGKQGTHFWYLTLQVPVSRGLSHFTSWGTITPKRGQTRADVFAELFNRVIEERPEFAEANVIAFDLQRNKL